MPPVTSVSWIRSIIVGLVLAASVEPVRTDRAQALQVTDALNLYDRGSYAEFLAAIDRDGAVNKELFKTFEKEADRWRKIASPSPQRRTLVAATVALEIAHLMRDQPADRAGAYFAWASKVVRENVKGAPTEPERLWQLAIVAGMQEGNEPWSMVLGLEPGNSSMVLQVGSLPPGGQLGIALKRFPEEPRLLLTRTQAAFGLIGLERSFTPGFLEFTRAVAASPVREEPRSPVERNDKGHRDIARRNLHRLTQIPQAIEASQALGAQPTLRGEITLRVGFLEAAQSNWPGALKSLAGVESLTDESDLRYLAQYFTGRIYQTLGNHTAAVDSFENALKLIPRARSASTLLAVELLLSDSAEHRARADELLRAAHSDLAPDDPWTFFFKGPARLWSRHMSQLREALR